MKILPKIISPTFIVLLALLATQVASKQFYRYRNESGNVIVKDQLTNEMIAGGYDVINENGKIIKSVGPGKTLGVVEQERLKAVEKKKQAIALKRKIRSDAELLRQFSSIGDIIRNRDAQLLALEQRIRIQSSKSDLLRLQLEDQQRQAATHERLGQKLPKLLQNDIDSTQNQIVDNEKNAVILEQEKVRVARVYERDIVRYKELESLRMTLKKEQAANDGSRAITYDCPDLPICQKAWQLAQIYAKDNASGAIEIITNTLILTSKPEKDSDLGLSFSRIPGPKGTNQILLEVSCNDSESGADLCKSDVVKNLRSNYLTLLSSRLD